MLPHLTSQAGTASFKELDFTGVSGHLSPCPLNAAKKRFHEAWPGSCWLRRAAPNVLHPSPVKMHLGPLRGWGVAGRGLSAGAQARHSAGAIPHSSEYQAGLDRPGRSEICCDGKAIAHHCFAVSNTLAGRKHHFPPSSRKVHFHI